MKRWHSGKSGGLRTSKEVRDISGLRVGQIIREMYLTFVVNISKQISRL